MAWVESHQSLRTHSKVGRLARALNVSKVTAVGHLHHLWWWAIDTAPDGDLSDEDAADIADGGGWNGAPDVFVDALVYAKLVDRDSNGLHLHDWNDYAGRLIERREANTERMRRARAAKAAEASIERAQHVQRTTVARAGATVPNRTQPNSTGPDRTGDDEARVRAQSRPKAAKAAAGNPPADLSEGARAVVDCWVEVMELKRPPKLRAVLAKKLEDYVRDYGVQALQASCDWAARQDGVTFDNMLNGCKKRAEGKVNGTSRQHPAIRNGSSGRAAGKGSPAPLALGGLNRYSIRSDRMEDPPGAS